MIDPGIAAVIGLAVGIATYGTGFAAIGGVKTMTGVMSQAGFTALVSKATITSLSNGMNMHDTLEKMASSDTVKSLAFAVLSAGLTKGLTGPGGLDLKPLSEASTFTDYAQFAVTKAGVNTTLEMGINGTDPGSALKNAAMSAATDTLASYAAGQIGKHYDPTGQIDKGLNYATHKALLNSLRNLGARVQQLIFPKNGIPPSILTARKFIKGMILSTPTLLIL